MGLGSLALSYASGALSTLSPCVLPLLPILLASALQQHVLGPLALALGVAGSFAGMGLFASSLGLSLGIDPSTLRFAAAILMLALGIVLLVPALQDELMLRMSPLSGWSGQLIGRLPVSGAGAQLLLGLVLGMVWSPCAGPTLGAAIGLAGQRETMLEAAAVMAIFGFGAATPLVALAYGSRQVVLSRRDRLRRVSAAAKPIMGIAVAGVGFSVLTGLDKIAETHLTNGLPDWLLNLTTRY
ncbi:MAG: cytochrome c biogenesis CcdA family protein [Hyphomonadaceae bacterium]|nr:cytochrome c biogenesis CcdA family protein [Hyphomonadaceae bacterium]